MTVEGSTPGVLLLAGSPSDLDAVLSAEETLADLEIPTRVRVASAHRTPDLVTGYVRSAEADGFGVIVAFAGLAAHLAGVVAAQTLLPVVGVPMSTSPLRGVDAALSNLQMPPGTPVATVAIDGARNAALLAARILAVDRPPLRARLERLEERSRERYATDAVEREVERRRKDRGRREP